MKILITNDDGIEGEGLRLLASWARKIGQITVVAPQTEQSACSQSIVLRRPFEFKKTDLLSDLGIEAWTVDSTPADCVRIAIDKLGPFDLVLSGMNRGINPGHFIAYSGTCAAAFEAHTEGLPAVAVSTDVGCLQEAAQEFDRVAAFFTEHRLLEIHDLYNVNIPPAFKDFRITRQEAAFAHDKFEPCGNDTYKAKLYLLEQQEKVADPDTDMSAYLRGYCSITPMRTDLTAYRVYKQLKPLTD